MNDLALPGKLEKLWIKRRRYFGQQAQAMSEAKLPQQHMCIATLLHRSYVERMAFALLAAILLGGASYLAWQNSRLQKELENPDAFFVPTHITDILRLRANTISDSLVYEFAESFVRDLTNLNYEDASYRLKDLGRYMHPSLKVDFMRSMEPHLSLWRSKKIDQIFSFEKISSFDRRSETFDGKERVIFTVPVWGQVRKYVEGRELPPYRELVTLKLTTANVTSDRSWVFEVLEIKRQTSQEIEDEKLNKNPKGEDK